MKIGVDVTMLVYTGSGVANYTFNLIKNLLKIDKKNTYSLFYSSLRRPENFYYLKSLQDQGGEVFDFRFPPSLLNLIWGRWHLLPVEGLIGKVDVFFSSDFLRPPLFPQTRGITTVHDLTWKIFPEYHEKRIIKAHEKKLEKTVKFADEIIVDSQNTKSDLTTHYPQIKPSRIHVIYPGISKLFTPIKDKIKINRVLQKYLTGYSLSNTNYLLYVGAIEPRKNLDLSIRVFHRLISQKGKYSDYKFLIAGRAGWKNKNIFQLIDDLNLENKVHFVGFVEDQDLPYLYSGASLCLYLSSYEGFGLPPLESLACGTPSLAGDNSSLKEILPRNFLVSLSDEKRILEKTLELINQKPNINSQEIKDKFAWKRTAREFMDVLKMMNNS